MNVKSWSHSRTILLNAVLLLIGLTLEMVVATQPDLSPLVGRHAGLVLIAAAILNKWLRLLTATPIAGTVAAAEALLAPAERRGVGGYQPLAEPAKHNPPPRDPDGFAQQPAVKARYSGRCTFEPGHDPAGGPVETIAEPARDLPAIQLRD